MTLTKSKIKRVIKESLEEEEEINYFRNLSKLITILKSNALNSPESIEQSFEIAVSFPKLLDMLMEAVVSSYGLGNNARFAKRLEHFYNIELIEEQEYMDILEAIRIQGANRSRVNRSILHHMNNEELLNQLLDKMYSTGNSFDVWQTFMNDNLSEEFYKSLILKYTDFASKGKFADQAHYFNAILKSKRMASSVIFKIPSKEMFEWAYNFNAMKEVPVLTDEWKKWAIE